jgi:type IV pilus assembly protein PilA
MLKLRKGFTLIELLIVVVIIGILAAIAIPKFANTKSKAYVTAAKSDLRNLVTAEEAFFADSSAYTSIIDNTVHLKYQNSTGTTAPAITVGAGFWFATNSHTQLPTGHQCGTSMNTTHPTVSTAAEGEPVCKVSQAYRVRRGLGKYRPCNCQGRAVLRGENLMLTASGAGRSFSPCPHARTAPVVKSSRAASRSTGTRCTSGPRG